MHKPIFLRDVLRRKAEAVMCLLTRLAKFSPRLKDKEEQGREIIDKGNRHGAMDYP